MYVMCHPYKAKTNWQTWLPSRCDNNSTTVAILCYELHLEGEWMNAQKKTMRNKKKLKTHCTQNANNEFTLKKNKTQKKNKTKRTG